MAIWITGDTHGDFSRLAEGVFPALDRLTKKDCLIVCGDFGGLWQGGSRERKRLDRLEATQAQHGERLEEMQETLTRVAVTQEGVVLPRIQMLFDGHSELKRELDTLATKEQVEELSADVSVIKDVVSRHSVDIGKLKRAQ